MKNCATHTRNLLRRRAQLKHTEECNGAASASYLQVCNCPQPAAFSPVVWTPPRNFHDDVHRSAILLTVNSWGDAALPTNDDSS
jgi:hypothetical protein